MCIFCKIINKELPSEIIYEDEDVIAIKDLHPITPNHTLVIPKNHSKNLMDVSSDDLSKVMITAKNLASTHISEGHAKGFNIIINNNSEANQVVDHLHVHIVYRNSIDDINYFSKK